MRKLKLFKILNSRGFSLVEVMVAAGILGVLSTALMTITKNVHVTSKKNAQELELGLLEIQIQEALSSQAGCRATFGVGGAGTNLNSGGNVNIASATGEQGAFPATVGIDPLPEVRDRNGDTLVAFGGDVGASDRKYYNVERLFVEPSTTTDVAVGDPFRSAPEEPLDRLKIKTYVNMILKKGTGNDVKERKTSLGSLRVMRRFALSLVINTGGDVVDCFFNQNEFVKDACDTLGGELEDGYCKRLQIGALSTTRRAEFAADAPNAAAIILGDLSLAQEDTPGVMLAADTESNLWVEGSGHIGPNKDREQLVEADAEEGSLSVESGLIVSQNIPNAAPIFSGAVTDTGYPAFGDDAQKGTGQIETSLGVGRTPPAAGVLVEQGLVVGDRGEAGVTDDASVPDDAQEGVAVVGNSIGINKVPEAQDGSLTMTGNMSIGDLSTNGPAGAAVNHPGGVGNIFAKGSLSVGDDFYANQEEGTAYVRDTLTVGNFPAAPSSAGSLGVSVQVEKYIDIPDQNNDDDLSDPDKGGYAVTAGWVANKLASTLSPLVSGGDNDIANDILESTATNPEDQAFKKVCENIEYTAADGVTLVRGVFTANRCELRTTYCNDSTNRCPTVYAGEGQNRPVANPNVSKVSVVAGGSIMAAGDVRAAKTLAAKEKVIAGQFSTNTMGEICLGGVCISSWNSLVPTQMSSCGWYNQCPSQTVPVALHVDMSNDFFHYYGFSPNPMYEVYSGDFSSTGNTISDMAIQINSDTMYCCQYQLKAN